MRKIPAIVALCLAGCLVEFPERAEDGTEAGIGGALTGHAPGDHIPGQPDPRPDPDGEGGAKAPAVPTGSPEPGSPPSDGPPPPPSDGPPPTAPPPGCEADLCEACNADGDIVALDTDIRCPNTDCAAFDIPQAGVNPATGAPTCRLLRTAMARTCAGPGECMAASAVTCLQNGQVRAEVEGATECDDIIGCGPGQDPRVVHKPIGAPCAGADGVCNGEGVCQRKDECLHARLSQDESFCAGASGLPADVCRFRVLPGSWDADPEPRDDDRVIDCNHFCRQNGWTCVQALENNGRCDVCILGEALCTIPDGCDQTFHLSDADLLFLWDGLLCDCRFGTGDGHDHEW